MVTDWRETADRADDRMRRKCCSDLSDEQLWRCLRGRGAILHRVKQQRAVVSLHRCEDGRQRRQRALWQGGTSPKVKRDDPLVQTQLAGDAVKRLWVQIQDGHQGGESWRSGGQEVPESPRTGGGTEEDQKGINERKRGQTCIAAVWLHLL